MNSRLIGVLAMALTGAVSAQAAGFALYGASAKGMALGGAPVGSALDASANFYNPATLADLDGTVITVGSCFEIPRAHVKVLDYGAQSTYKGRLNPGCFYLPHAYLSQPLFSGLTFGLGLAPEFGLGSEYNASWPLAWNTTQTTVEGFVVNPNLTYEITEDWSVSAGFRILYFTFEQYKRPQAAANGINAGTLDSHLKGDNGFADFGFQLSTRYRITENLSLGVMYRSAIETKVRGHYNTRVMGYDYSAVPLLVAGMGITPTNPAYPSAVAQTKQKIKNNVDAAAARNNGRGAAGIRLPQSLVAGLTWDVTENWHIMPAVTWTQWSTMDSIYFHLEGDDQYVPLRWRDTYRGSLGTAWEFAENWTLMGSYVYDMDPCDTDPNIGSTMLPAGSRHLMTAGLSWRVGDFELTGCYGLILMSGRDQDYYDAIGNRYHFSTSAGRSHQLGLSLSYYF